MKEAFDSSSRDEYQRLRAACRAAYDEIIDFVTSAPFKTVHDELMALPPARRPAYVVEVLLDDDALRARGVSRPRDLLIQRSAFGDRRPTLFCVKKWLPQEFHKFWENVNITIDNAYEDESIPRDATAWRAPLPLPIQHEYLSGNLSSKDVDAVIDFLRPSTTLNL